MDRSGAIAALKELVATDIRYLCRRVDRAWSAPIVETMRELRNVGGRSVFFGGSIRSLLISRLLHGRLGRPRDVDVVVDDVTIDTLRKQFKQLISRETRFGGLQLVRSTWHFDVWPLLSTWAFIHGKVSHASFDRLPATTFFNLEAIAVEVWPSPGTTRVVFAGDDQFFHGILNRTLELNMEENPFPSLCVTRALVMASTLDFAIGERLARYLVSHNNDVSADDIHNVQLKHYGKLRVRPDLAKEWISYISRNIDKGFSGRLTLPISRQGTLWPEPEGCYWPMWSHLFRADSESE